MSKESQRRKAERAFQRADRGEAAPNNFVVLKLDIYGAEFGFSSVADVFGPFSEETARLFKTAREADDEYAVEYQVTKMSNP